MAPRQATRCFRPEIDVADDDGAKAGLGIAARAAPGVDAALPCQALAGGEGDAVAGVQQLGIVRGDEAAVAKGDGGDAAFERGKFVPLAAVLEMVRMWPIFAPPPTATNRPAPWATLNSTLSSSAATSLQRWSFSHARPSRELDPPPAVADRDEQAGLRGKACR